MPDGEHHLVDTGGFDAEEDVRLVFVFVSAAGEGGVPVVCVEAGVVPGGDDLGAELAGLVVEAAELEPVVAADAGVGCSARGVLVDEVVDDLGEAVFEVADVEGDAEFCGDVAGVVRVADGAAPLFADFGGGRVAGLFDGFALGAEAHEDPDDLVALTHQQPGGDGGIHAARHRDNYFAFGRGHQGDRTGRGAVGIACGPHPEGREGLLVR